MRLLGLKASNPQKSLVKEALIVVRQIETKAAYAKGKQDNAKTLAEKLAELGNVHLIRTVQWGRSGTFGESSF